MGANESSVGLLELEESPKEELEEEFESEEALEEEALCERESLPLGEGEESLFPKSKISHDVRRSGEIKKPNEAKERILVQFSLFIGRSAPRPGRLYRLSRPPKALHFRRKRQPIGQE